MLWQFFPLKSKYSNLIKLNINQLAAVLELAAAVFLWYKFTMQAQVFPYRFHPMLWQFFPTENFLNRTGIFDW